MRKKIRGVFFRRRLQRFIASSLFPVGKGDWYKSKGYGTKGTVGDAFSDFMEKQKSDEKAHYFRQFKGLDFTLDTVPTQLASGEKCKLEVLTCSLENSSIIQPGTGKHIVYFPGANTYYQACFRDISTACNETGATIHAFNFPGTGLSTGKVLEVNDLVNSGLSLVVSLIRQGVHPDDIILQGDCYGAAIALEVKQHLEMQAHIKVRLIMNNAFKSFKAAICDMITQSPWLPAALKKIVKRLLEFTGWTVTPGKKYKYADPYQCHIQHLDDQTLKTSTLSSKVGKYVDEGKSGETMSKKRAIIADNCPQEYQKDRDALDMKHYVRVSEVAKTRLAEKFGVDKFGKVNSHFADLCELETLSGQSVYTAFVNDYLQRSDSYIKMNPQRSLSDLQANLAQLYYRKPAVEFSIGSDEAEVFDTVVDLITETQKQPSNTATPGV